MTTLHRTVFSPEAGEIIELPETVGRIDYDRVGSPTYGYGTLKIGVVGYGDMVEHVVLKVNADSADIKEGSQILCTDVATGKIWYAVPVSAYGGRE